jgi:hypothetical protein
VDSHNSYKPLFTTRTRVSNAGAILCQLAQYALCVALGLLGGALGVALAVGLAILIQLRLPPAAVFTPGTVPLMVIGTGAGLACSWLLSRQAHRTWPDLASDTRLNSLQVILVSSVFASLAQSLLFFA